MSFNESYAVVFEDTEAFYAAINEFLVRGLTFKAFHKELTIYLTGGY
tara:strand:- start:70 stop:210 length:141 start_codon:yes stop_codon:yes gene_type:complete